GERDAALAAERCLDEAEAHRLHLPGLGVAAAAGRAGIPTTAEQLGDDLLEGKIAAAGSPAIGARAVGAKAGALVAAGAVDFASVEAGPLPGIRQQVVGRGNLLELLLVGTVAGAEIGMQLLRQPAISPLDVVVGRVSGDAEHGIGIPHDVRPMTGAAIWIHGCGVAGAS